jgi:hypothetical protein
MAVNPITITSFTVPDGIDFLAYYLSQKGDGRNLKKRLRRFSSAVGPSAAMGADTIFLSQGTLAASASVTLDLTSYTDVCGRTTSAMVRMKGLFIWHIGTDDDSSITSPSSGLTLGAAASNQATLFFGTEATDTLTIPSGGFYCQWTPLAAGVTVDGTHKSVKIANDDASNSAQYRAVFWGGSA